MDHQDWKPVVLNKRVKKSAQPNYVKRKDFDETPPDKVSIGLSKQIIQKRSELKLTQVQLAQKCNLTPQIVKKYENGSAIPTINELTKLRRVLGKLTR